MNAVVAALAKAKVRFVVIGGQAVRILGYPRATIDWDLFVPPRDEENFKKIDAVLNEIATPGEYDMGIVALGPKGENFIQTYQLQWCLLQFHLVVPGIKSFEEAEQQAVEVTDGGVAFKRLSGLMLLKAKEAAGRAQDQEDIKFLRELQRGGRLV
jgi:predicted nucleotidyltransferase